MQSFQAPLRKGSSAEGGEGLFFYNLSTTSWSPSPYTGEANSEPLSARPASVLRTLANPLCQGSSAEGGEGFFLQHSNRCAVSEPVSATPASVLRTLANPFTQGSLFFFSSILSLLSAQRFVPRRKCVKKFYKKRKIYGNKSEYMI